MVSRVWAPKGQRPTAWVRRRYAWLSGSGFVRPRTGQTWWCLRPTVNTEAFSLALPEFARDEGIDAAHRAVLVLDQAGWPTAKELVLAAGSALVFLPPAAPELQPAERRWGLVDEPVAKRTFPHLDALEATLVTRCRELEQPRPSIKPRTRSHWWPRERRRKHK